MERKELPYGNAIVSFTSFEEMQAYFAEAEAANEAATQPWQREITWGDHVVRMHEYPDGVLAIWGHIYTIEEFIDAEEKAGAPGTQIVAELRQLRARHAEGHRYGRWHSVIEPAGEIGDVHA